MQDAHPKFKKSEFNSPQLNMEDKKKYLLTEE
jgi:hypothetical protein